MKRLLSVISVICAVGLAQAKTPPSDQIIAHLLNRIAFGPRAEDVERVRVLGIDRYIDQQLHPERVADAAIEARLSSLTTLRMTSRELGEAAAQPRRSGQGPATANDPVAAAMRPPQRPPDAIAELAEQKLLRAIYSERQLQEVLTDFWFNHFNVDARKGPARLMLTEYERETIRPLVLGRFRDLLEATARSPAMLFYLDNWMSAAESGIGPSARRPRRGLNENYARELMELHTLGADGGYTQKDVTEVARAFTGWTIDNPRLGGGFKFDPRLHDSGEKIVLGHRIKAGGGIEDGEQVLDILAEHPSTARFIATALARRFVSDQPPRSLVNRATERFRRSQGDLRAVTRAILISREFKSPASHRTKLKTPFEFVVSALRVTGADVRDARPLVRTLQQFGMPLYHCQPPTGYSDAADAWVNAGALVDRMNFASALSSRAVRGVSVPVSTIIRPALQPELSPPTRAAVGRAATLNQALVLMLGAPEFQRR